MAKNGSTPTGGLSSMLEGLDFGRSQSQEVSQKSRVDNPTVPITKPAPDAQETAQAEAPTGMVVEAYRNTLKAKPEGRTVRLACVVTPRVAQAIERACASGDIKSRNDLVNFLLEKWCDEVEAERNAQQNG